MAEIVRGSTPGEVIVRRAARVERMFAIAAGPVTWVFHDGVTYEIVEQAPRRKHAGAHESLTAPMPATVIQVNANVGSDVRRGDILILLEAMKMELPLRAPADGRVAAVHCSAGDLVQPGATLVELA